MESQQRQLWAGVALIIALASQDIKRRPFPFVRNATLAAGSNSLIQTNAYSAEFGRSSGAVVNATIKSGSNSIRGSVYQFLRNEALDANNLFSNALGAPKPRRDRNQFGGAAGGTALPTGPWAICCWGCRPSWR